MQGDDESSRQHQTPDGEPRLSGEADDASSADAWSDGFTAVSADPDAVNLFSSEIENVNATDWDIDAALIWGDDAGPAAVQDEGVTGHDFSL